MLFIPNGAIVQQVLSPTDYISLPLIEYRGINAFHQYPLCDFTDYVARVLTDQVFSKEYPDGTFQQLEFISSYDVLLRYTAECNKRGIPIRILFIESQYNSEVWKEKIPDKKIIGYEYCEIPFDSQIITDFSWYEPLKIHYKRLNEYGVFNTVEDVINFKNDYEQEVSRGKIGDGEMNAYICRVSEIDLNVIKNRF